mgnify:CR=1 FL=1
MLVLRLFIEGEPTYEWTSFPPAADYEPCVVSAYVDGRGLDKTAEWPDNCPELEDIQHEFKILWEEN